MEELKNLNELDEKSRVAFYGLLFSMAVADGTMDKGEISYIMEAMETAGLSEESKQEVARYMHSPPALEEGLRMLSEVDDTYRFGIMFSLLEVALLDERLVEEEKRFLVKVKSALNINDDQFKAMLKFLNESKKISNRRLDDTMAVEAIKKAASGLAAVGVPLTSIYFSGSVLGLSAAGITSGLAALGLGFGMVSGIGVAILLGAGVFVGSSKLMNIGKEKRSEIRTLENERKAQVVIENLQTALGCLTKKVSDLKEQAMDVQINKEALILLEERIGKLQDLIKRRKMRERGEDR